MVSRASDGTNARNTNSILRCQGKFSRVRDAIHDRVVCCPTLSTPVLRLLRCQLQCFDCYAVNSSASIATLSTPVLPLLRCQLQCFHCYAINSSASISTLSTPVLLLSRCQLQCFYYYAVNYSTLLIPYIWQCIYPFKGILYSLLTTDCYVQFPRILRSPPSALPSALLK